MGQSHAAGGPPPQEMLARRCDSATRYYDVLVHHAARPLTDVEKGFISALREEIRSLPQT